MGHTPFMKLLLCSVFVACCVYSTAVPDVDCNNIDYQHCDKTPGCTWGHWGCEKKSRSAALMAPMAMNVSVINNVGKPLQIRQVVQGVKGGTICAMPKPGDTCTGIHTDWIASATDGSWDAGDVFSEWWGDPSWNTAVAKYSLTQGQGSYIIYKQVKM